RSLSEKDFRRLVPALQAMPLTLRQVVVEPHAPIETVYFVEQGLVSVVAGSPAGILEFGIIGLDGLVGVPLAMGVDRTPYRYLVQVPGEAFAMSAASLDELMRTTSLRELLLRYAHLVHLQTVETALA